MKAYLQATEVINWKHPAIVELAQKLASAQPNSLAIAQACFEWVRDRISHSCDDRKNPVTCRASEVLYYQTGYCYAKSHLLAALLRANNIPAGLCYQRLSIDDRGDRYSLHGFNAIYLPTFGWYRVDPRGNRSGINAQFIPPQEQLAYQIKLSPEADFPAILPEPLEIVVKALSSYRTWDRMLQNLPDVSWEIAESYGLR